MRNGDLKSNETYKFGFKKRLVIASLALALFTGSVVGLTSYTTRHIDPVSSVTEGFGITEQVPTTSQTTEEVTTTNKPTETKPVETEDNQNNNENPGEIGNQGNNNQGNQGNNNQGNNEQGGETGNTPSGSGGNNQGETIEHDLPQTLDELFAPGNEEYVNILAKSLNDNLYNKMVSKTMSPDVESVRDARWELISSDGVNVDKIRMFAINDVREGSSEFLVTSVALSTPLTIKELMYPDPEEFEAIFSNTKSNGVKYRMEHVLSYNPTVQGTRDELINAINAKLMEDGVIHPVDQDTLTIFVEEGVHVIPGMGTTREIIVLNVNDDFIEEVNINIQENQLNNNDQTLIENLNKGNYIDVGNLQVYIECSPYVFDNQTSLITGEVIEMDAGGLGLEF